ncbi:MAG TPA: limonene-1,2-epoxide hydrolase family protein [Chloroflexota bacterium]|nr:limonene-1,2-epoxide hydrolase family protein [Chloroflexota bacterium]
MPVPPDPIARIRAFCAAWSHRDAAELGAYFAAGAIYHNVPMEPVSGADAIRAWLERFFVQCSSAEFELRHIAAAGEVVMTERIDRFVIAGRRIDLPVAGVFELRDGQIVAWRDYFDLATWTRQATD